MHRLTARTLTVVSLAGLLAAASLPAQAKSSRPKQHRGKKAMGEIVSFDAATSTLVVDLAGEEDFTGAVDPGVQVKIDHRGWAKRDGDSHGNPTEGSVEDLLPGTPVLRMKVEDDVVTKIRIRPTGEETPLPPAETEDDTTEDTTEATTEDSTEDSDSNPDEGEDLGDPEDALLPCRCPSRSVIRGTRGLKVRAYRKERPSPPAAPFALAWF